MWDFGILALSRVSLNCYMDGIVGSRSWLDSVLAVIQMGLWVPGVDLTWFYLL